MKSTGQRHKTRQFNYRKFSVRAESIDKEERTVDTVITTETPVPIIDFDRGAIIPEVLLTRGAELPIQVPLLDSHNRNTVADQVGSVRNMRRTDSGIVGTLHISSVAEELWTKIREGHITDVSAGYRVIDRIFVPKGESRSIRGKTYDGPVNVTTRWKLGEVSTLPIGADELAKLRGINPSVIESWESEIEQDNQFPENERGALSHLLNSLIQNKVNEHTTEETIHSQMASAADIEPGTVNQILSASITCPPLHRLEGFAKVLGVSVGRIVEAAKKDGCNYKMRKDQFTMNEQLRSMLINSGMPANLDDAAAQNWLISNRDKVAAPATDPPPETNNRDENRELILREERDRTLNIRTACDMQGVPSTVADELIERGATLLEANAAIRKWRAENQDNDPVATNITVTRSEQEKIAPHIVDGLTLRVMHGDVQAVTGGTREISNEARQFGNMRLCEIARRCLAAHGVSTVGMTDPELAMRAIRSEPQGLGLAIRSDGAFHSPSTLPGLLLETGQRVMLAGFQEAPSRWREWVQVGDPVNDFRPVAMYGGDEGGLLDMVPDDDELQEDKASELKETTSAELFGKAISFTYRSIVNDDLGFLSARLSRRGRMADRTINRQAVSLLPSNPQLGNDSKAVFHADHNNLIASGAAPSVAQLGVMRKLLRKQVGINANVELNLEMKTLIVPAALETAAESVIFSAADPSKSNDITYNPFRNKIGLVVEPILDATSELKYWGLTDWRDHPFVVIRFLRGQENPILGESFNSKKLAREYTVYQTWAGPTIVDYRGAVENAGA